MVHKTRPAPLKDLQIAVQADQSRRYLLDVHSSLPSPAYPFEPLPHTRQAEVGDCRWHDPLDDRDGDPVRPFTPPISPPALSPRAQDATRSSKRSGRTFALVPAQVNGKHVFTHVVKDSDAKQVVSPQEDRLPEDMQDMLRQLDDLASWVKAASSPRDYNVPSVMHATRLPGHSGTDAVGHTTRNLSDKGKNRLLPASPPGERDIHRDLVDPPRGAVSGHPIGISGSVNCQLEGFIYTPDCSTPEFLAGSSSSPVAYPVRGYSSHNSYSSQHPDTAHDTPYHRRFLERRSAPCPPPSSRSSRPPGKTSLKVLFQRPRRNTTMVARPTIPSGHLPVENALRQGKRLRFPWLQI